MTDRLVEEIVGDLAEALPTVDRHVGWEDVDLEAVVHGDRPEPPTVARVGDGVGLFYRTKVNQVIGPPETGKSWIAVVAGAEVLAAGGEVIVIDYEADAHTLVDRLTVLGTTCEAITARVHYKRPIGPVDPALSEVCDLAARCGLVVVDGVNEAMAAHGLDPNSNRDVAEFHRRVARPLADVGPAVVLVDHVTKARDGPGFYPVGGGHKLALCSGTQINVAATVPFSRTSSGKSKLVVGKDRTGFFQTGRHVADLVVTVEARTTVCLEPVEVGEERGLELEMQRISDWLESNPGEHPTRKVINSVTGQRDKLSAALQRLEDRGHVRRRQVGRSKLCSLIAPFAP